VKADEVKALKDEVNALKERVKVLKERLILLYDDAKKRNKLVEDEEGGVIRLDEKKALVRHLDMITCVKEGTKIPDVYAMPIDTIRDINIGPLKVATLWHWKQTFTSYDDKRYHIKDYYHSMAFGHSEVTPLIPIKEIIANYRKYLKEHNEEI
jgi:hypothetical protein